MARIRCVKPEFWTSQQIVECSPIARLLFVGMWNFADDRGVIPRRPRTIKMQVFPGDDFTADQIDAMLTELESQHLVGRFEADGECYLAITGWHHQKIERPTYKYPAPPEALQFGEVSANARRQVAERSPPEGNGEEGIGKDTDRTRKRAAFVQPTIEEVQAYCQERKSSVDPEAWHAYYSANGWRVGRNPMRDWQAAVRTWEKNGYSSKADEAKPPASRVATKEDAERWEF